MRQTIPRTTNQPGMAEPRFSTDGFDAVPPPDVIEELRQRSSRRPPPPPVTPPLVKPVPPARDWRGSALAILGVALVGVILTSQSRQQAPQMAGVARPEPIPAAPLAATPRAAVQPPVRRAEPVPVVVRRAELVPIVVRRGELVSLPIGTSGTITMPDDGQVITVTYRGAVPTFRQLPSYPQIGDMWKVSESAHEWVWCVPNGFVVPAWVDP